MTETSKKSNTTYKRNFLKITETSKYQIIGYINYKNQMYGSCDQKFSNEIKQSRKFAVSVIGKIKQYVINHLSKNGWDMSLPQ